MLVKMAAHGLSKLLHPVFMLIVLNINKIGSISAKIKKCENLEECLNIILYTYLTNVLDLLQ